MAETWPTALQSKLNEASFSFEIGDTLLRTQNQMGPAKVRRLMTKSVDVLSGSIDLTVAEYSTFFYFFDTTLNGGVKTFNFNHPITGSAEEFRFVGTPTFSSLGGGNFRVTFRWEILP